MAGKYGVTCSPAFGGQHDCHNLYPKDCTGHRRRRLGSQGGGISPIQFPATACLAERHVACALDRFYCMGSQQIFWMQH